MILPRGFSYPSLLASAVTLLAGTAFNTFAQTQAAPMQTEPVQNAPQYLRYDTPPKLCVGDTWTYLGNEFIVTNPWTATVQSVNNGIATIVRQGTPEVGQKRERIEIR